MWLRITSLNIPYERGPLGVGATALWASPLKALLSCYTSGSYGITIKMYSVLTTSEKFDPPWRLSPLNYGE